MVASLLTAGGSLLVLVAGLGRRWLEVRQARRLAALRSNLVRTRSREPISSAVYLWPNAVEPVRGTDRLDVHTLASPKVGARDTE